jgi:hypothetical protein
MANTTTTTRFECSDIKIKDETKQENQHLAQARLSSVGDQASLTFILGTKILSIQVSKKEADKFLESCRREKLTLIME